MGDKRFIAVILIGGIALVIGDPLLPLLFVSQLFWLRQLVNATERLLHGRPRRQWIEGVAALTIILLIANGFARLDSPAWDNTHLNRLALVFEEIFWVWFVGCFAGFVLYAVFWSAAHAVAGAIRLYRRVTASTAAVSLPRREFLTRTAILVSATPFAAAGYGLVRGRMDLEITHQPIVLPRLPKAFHGFRIAQLSDLHISAFTTAEDLRRCVTITNDLGPDLVALTGDFVTWDANAQRDITEVLARLRAPHGVFGCLGNHEVYTETQDSLSHLLADAGIRILRHAAVPIASGPDQFNLIGVDFQGCHDCPVPFPTNAYLVGVERLIAPDTVNVLLSHNPNSFDRAAGLGIDLTLSGHTHGGQLSLEFIHRGLSLSHVAFPRDRGWYRKGASQLYVNRGIGTIILPIRFGSRPEITILELLS
jgi:uncharacterized protein